MSEQLKVYYNRYSSNCYELGENNESILSKQASFYEYLSLNVWGSLPSSFQRFISRVYASIFNLKVTRYLINPYCKVYYQESNYLAQFKPPFGKERFESFQDFFIRELKELPIVKSSSVWPCEGLLCDLDYVRNIQKVNVKGDRRKVHDIFGLEKNEIPEDFVFLNVFLHNKNYHRIHAPIEGRVKRIQHIKGDLVILRPWIYEQNPSIPAFRNERINLDIEDNHGRMWHLSIIGGPAVGTIEIPDKIKVGAKVNLMNEIGLFYLGSTCCMISPEMPINRAKNSLVFMGEQY